MLPARPVEGTFVIQVWVVMSYVVVAVFVADEKVTFHCPQSGHRGERVNEPSMICSE
jgi:hypothetical protein